MNCPACGTKILDRDVYDCPRCRRPLTKDRAAAHVPCRPETDESDPGPARPGPSDRELCPDCKNDGRTSYLVREEGCMKCQICGYGYCG